MRKWEWEGVGAEGKRGRAEWCSGVRVKEQGGV